jgi:NAD-dependent SIR2 family protein deacetylase
LKAEVLENEEGSVFSHKMIERFRRAKRVVVITGAGISAQSGALLRPDVVWFGESLSERDLVDSCTALKECDCLVVDGTLAVVQPVAPFPTIARNGGAFILEINVEPTPISGWVDESILGKSGQIVDQLLESMKLFFLHFFLDKPYIL